MKTKKMKIKESLILNYMRLNICTTTFIIVWLIWFAGISLAQSTTQKQIDSIFTSFYHSEEPGAVIIILQGKEVVFRNAYGLANIERKLSMNPDMVFGLASVTKPITATAIMILEEEGRLSVKDEITKYLPDYKNGTGITIEHLLAHASGIKTSASMLKERRDWRYKKLSPDELIDIFRNEPLSFSPGESYEYNHFNYVLLGRIIEVISGKSWETYIKESIFKPSNMTHSYYGGHNRTIPGAVTAYHKEPDGWRIAPNLSWTSGYAGGGLFSSVDDLANWYLALDQKKLLKASTLDRMFSPFRLNNGLPSPRGYGWMIKDIGRYRLLAHGGNIIGYRTFIALLPEKDIFVAILTNGTGRYSQYDNPRRQAIKAIKLLLTN